MRQYKKEEKDILILEKIICNQCGKEIVVSGGVPSEDVLEVEKQWGYFSGKDGRRDRFALCEACYDALLEGFCVPTEMEE